MLELIEFKSTDELYICGDVVDRGPNPLEIIDYIVSHKNIHLIKGNHEKMYEESYECGDYSLWYYNGGRITHNQIMNRDYIYNDSLYKYISKLPYVMIVDKFILVHASIFLPNNHNELSITELIEMQEEDTCLWDRSNIDNDSKFKDYTIICGHTPVQTITYNYDDVKILHQKGHIYIDCGCVFKHRNGKLACLRLDDMKEFYI